MKTAPHRHRWHRHRQRHRHRQTQANQIWVVLQLRLLSQVTLGCVKLRVKANYGIKVLLRKPTVLRDIGRRHRLLSSEWSYLLADKMVRVPSLSGQRMTEVLVSDPVSHRFCLLQLCSYLHYPCLWSFQKLYSFSKTFGLMYSKCTCAFYTQVTASFFIITQYFCLHMQWIL